MDLNQSIPEKVESVKGLGRQMLNKVPQVTIFFWMIKIMAANVGQTAADFFHYNLNFGLTNTSVIMTGFFIVTFYFQFRAKKYVPSIYWLVVVFISVLGTILSEILTNQLKLPLVLTTIALLVLLVVHFLIWYLSEKKLSLYSIHSRKREVFYWLSILLTFALGTSLGNWAFEELSLGYFWSALMFAALLGVIAIAYRDYQMKADLAFWLAYFFTCPFGALLGNVFSKPVHSGGLGLGEIGTSLIFLFMIVILVIYLNKTGKDKSPLLS